MMQVGVKQMKSQHMMRINDCVQDGSIQYLAARERKKGITISIVHCDRRDTDKRVSRTVAYLKHRDLNIHESGNSDPGDAGNATKSMSEILQEMSRLVREAQMSTRTRDEDL